MNAAHNDNARCRDTSAGRSHHDRDFYAVLLGMAGHDLRQPLQVLQSAHELLTHHVGDGPAKAHLDRGQRAISLITDQLDQLVAAMRIFDQTSKMTLTEVPLDPLLPRIVSDNLEFAAARNVELRILRSRAVILSNEVVVHGIVRNLVSNAIKYTPAGQSVLVGCRRLGTNVRIDIRDTGIGIARHQVPKVFEAFKRLDSSNADGLGLGLFVVRRAVALLGHRIEAHSRGRVPLLDRSSPRRELSACASGRVCKI